MQRAIENISLFVLIAVAMIRPLVAESYDSAGSPISEALSSVGDPSPVRTLVFDLLILGGAVGWALARAIDPARRYRRTGLEWGLALVLIGAVMSCVFAGNQRLAINATVDWLCLPILTITLVQLMRHPWQRHLLLAAVLASACVQVFQCAEQYFGGFDDTLAHYESIKADFWARQGVDLDSAKVESFERRMRAREASGSLPHSNVTGSYLVLCGLAAAGLTLARWRRGLNGSLRAVATVSTALAVALLWAVGLTGSLGAMIAGGAGAVLWLILHVFRAWIDANRKRALIIGWALAGGGVLATMGHGLYHDSLPGWSLTFRWQYWTASSEMIADHPLTGVGRENFGRHYLAYKDIASPEEVSNPHNLFVQAAADWGLIGLTGIVVMLVGASVRLCPSRCDDRATDLNRPADGPKLWLWLAGLLAVLIIGRLPLLGTIDPNYLYYVSMTTGLVWLLGFCVFGLTAAPSGSAQIRMGISIGLVAFLVHDMINFAAFVPGSATTCFALLAVALADRPDDRPAPQASIGPHWLMAGVGIAIALGVAWLCLLPVARASHHVQQARGAMGGQVATPVEALSATRAFQRAIEADPLDPAACVEAARWLTGLATVPHMRQEALRLATEHLHEAIRRDPQRAKLHRLHMQLLLERARGTTDKTLFQQAIKAGEAALERYPQNPDGIAVLADCKLAAGEATGADDWLNEAIADYERALTLDGQRLSWEELHGFRERRIVQIREKIDQAKRRLSEQR